MIVLAAGQSKRFGGIKQLAKLNGVPLICHSVAPFFENDNLLTGLNNLTVVLGSNSEKIKQALPAFISTFYVRQWAQGMGRSLAEGVKHLGHSPTHIFVALADQLCLDKQLINEMLMICKHHPSKIVAAQYNHHLGVPAIFPSQYFSALRQLSDDKGARGLIHMNRQNVVSLAIPTAAYDIDTTQDFLSFKQNIL
ncbi:nucleotidyltransferase family protein [Paraglaciecola aquimarina]|uniref:Nucleotidyltransferase family protein n=1 Tax=Paraglaciecola aquimarina TaxID=1235557 RepID=A0ABU3SYT2_9ALTE|nr:nucleotidyltransferase family protein [Paraglaciecola aquimarina]MDU0355169.1 nucleotidyltransferase family protein [Paraglaciecola aquimarina]